MHVDDEGGNVNRGNAGDFRLGHLAPLQSHDAQYVDNGSVSTLYRCQTVDAKKLCIYDLNYKIKISNEYDIGGTYTGDEPDLWFYYSTSVCPGYNYLLNLFVCHRKTGNFSIGVSSSNELRTRDRPAETLSINMLPRALWFTFKSSTPNENYHVKTFCFTEKDLKLFNDNTVFVPISIVLNSSHSLDSEIIKSIKLQHDLSGMLTNQENTDFTLKSAAGTEFPTHTIILTAHSSILRSLIKDSKTASLSIDISDHDMNLLLEFLYTGTIKDILNKNFVSLLKIAKKFNLPNLFLLAEYAIAEQLHYENAVEVALLAQKYKLENLRHKVLSFIKNNPRVMYTEGWINLKDVGVTKQLVEHIYAARGFIE